MPVAPNHMQFLDALVEQTCCINWVNGCETGLEGLRDVNSLVALGTKHFKSHW